MFDCDFMTNITPQTAELNQRIWKNLEEKARGLAKRNETLVESFLIPNICSKHDSLINYFIRVDELELKINLDLFSQLPDSI